MKVKHFILKLFYIFIILISSILITEAQSNDWKIISKTAGVTDYVGNLRIVKSNSGINIVNYSRIIDYSVPKNFSQYGASQPVSRVKENGRLDCYNASYSFNTEALYDKSGKTINAQKLWQLKGSKKQVQNGSFYQKIYNLYCEPEKVEKYKQQMAQQEVIETKKAQNIANEKEAKQNKLKSYFQPIVKEYGTISLVEQCSEIGETGCDYRVHTSFKVYGNLPKGVQSGFIPVFAKGNTIHLKSNKIVKATGDGKEKDVNAQYKKKWQQKKY